MHFILELSGVTPLCTAWLKPEAQIKFKKSWGTPEQGWQSGELDVSQQIVHVRAIDPGPLPVTTLNG
jgi:hypothetical protein